MANYDILGNIAIVKFERKTKFNEKKKFALNFLKQNKNVRTVLEKAGKFSGRLRTQKTKFIAGEKNKEALYRENGCNFRLNVDTCYFSPRLSSERKEIAKKIVRGENVLVLFGGVGPFAIVIAKISNARRVVSIELGRECSKYAEINVKLNKVSERVEIIQGEARKKLKVIKEKFDRIVMARPNLEDNFLDAVFPRIKKAGIIHYYGFYEGDEENKFKKMINEEAIKAKRRIKILKIKKAGEIGTNRFRFRVDVKVVN
ncbi:MAG: hypothetical protein Q7S27_03295 [Nanoarchaeota archaeon]|nr:hypothetical protein [Nanoarchaeota archaeon]